MNNPVVRAIVIIIGAILALRIAQGLLHIVLGLVQSAASIAVLAAVIWVAWKLIKGERLAL